MADYEIRLYKTDGSLSIILVIVAIGALDARAQAFAMMKDGIVSAEIWTGLTLVEVIHLDGTLPN